MAQTVKCDGMRHAVSGIDGWVGTMCGLLTVGMVEEMWALNIDCPTCQREWAQQYE